MDRPPLCGILQSSLYLLPSQVCTPNRVSLKGSVAGMSPPDPSDSPLFPAGSHRVLSLLRITVLLDWLTLSQDIGVGMSTPNLFLIPQLSTPSLSISHVCPLGMTTCRRDSLGGGRPHVDTHVSLISPHLLSLQTTTRHQCERVPPQRLQPVRAREALEQHPLSQDPYTRERERSRRYFPLARQSGATTRLIDVGAFSLSLNPFKVTHFVAYYTPCSDSGRGYDFTFGLVTQMDCISLHTQQQNVKSLQVRLHHYLFLLIPNSLGFLDRTARPIGYSQKSSFGGASSLDPTELSWLTDPQKS